MREDGDFEAYLVARWVPVVRTLVMLGCTEPTAVRIARAAFARLRSGWGGARESDVDAHAYAHVVEEWRRARAARGAAPRDPVVGTDDRWSALEPVLDRLPYDVRAALLLRHVAGLGEAQLAEVLGHPPDLGGTPDGEEVREAAASVAVMTPSLDEVRQVQREQRRHRRGLATRWVAGAVVVVGVATWWGTRSAHHDPDVLGVAATVAGENPADVAWYANGRLHLAHVAIDLPPLRELVAVNGGAVYVDQDGAVVHVADDGARTRLGSTDAGSPLVGSDEEGWVSWSDTAGVEPVLVLYDLTSRQRIRAVTPPDPERESATRLLPVAIDQGLLYFRTEQGTSYAVSPDGVAQPVGQDLLDVRSATRVFQSDPGSIRMLQSFFSTVTSGLGVGAQLSPDGNLALTRVPSPQSQFGTVQLYDTRSGELLPTGLGADEVAIDATFGPENTVTYIVARLADRPSSDEFVRQSFSGALELRSCSVEVPVPSCQVDAKFPSTGSTPLLGPTG
jgi:hypothetical protein